MSIKDKYNRPRPDQNPPKKKGNLEVIKKMVVNGTVNTGLQQTVNTEKKIKKATFELDLNLHKRLRTLAALNETTMLDIVEKALHEYLDKLEN